jgi:hypothetical protein
MHASLFTYDHYTLSQQLHYEPGTLTCDHLAEPPIISTQNSHLLYGSGKGNLHNRSVSIRMLLLRPWTASGVREA